MDNASGQPQSPAPAPAKHAKVSDAFSGLGLLILAFALLSRVYNLSIFPYFPQGAPWMGASPSPPYASLSGLYVDEYSIFTERISSILVFGPLSKSLIHLATGSLGTTIIAVRLPFAVASSISAVLVYLTTLELANSRVAAFLSASYFIVMMPALMYGRMAFSDNIIALFFLLTFLALTRLKADVNKGGGRKWFLLATLFSILAAAAKLEGVIVLIFFLAFLTKYRLLRKGTPYILLTVVFGVASFVILGYVNHQAPGAVIQNTLSQLQSVGGLVAGNELSVWRFFFLDGMPAGFQVMWGGLGGFPVPEFWYIFIYLGLGVLLLYEYPRYSDLLLALGVFVAVMVTLTPLGYYFLIIIQPLLAIAFGPSLKHLFKMPASAALGFYTFLFVPLAMSIGINLIIPSELGIVVIINNTLFLWKLLTLVPPLALILFTLRGNTKGSALRVWVNGTLIVIFFIALFIASYSVSDLYPYFPTLFPL